MPAIDSIRTQSVNHTESQSNIWVVGRHLLSSCQLTLPGTHILKPNPELQAAVDQALAEEDLARRAQKLDAVWQCYGRVYVDSVEMGGMCYLACTATKSDTVCASDLAPVHWRCVCSRARSGHPRDGGWRDEEDPQQDIWISG